MWSALIRKWDSERGVYQTLTVRVEDTDQPGWLLRVYDGQTAIAEVLAEDTQSAMDQALEVIQVHLRDPSITQESLAWVQV